MPIYEFECEKCGNRFEELLPPARAPGPACPRCGSSRTRRRLSTVAPSSRQPSGAGIRSGEARRREREAARQERLAETKRRRAAGETPPRRGGKAS